MIGISAYVRVSRRKKIGISAIECVFKCNKDWYSRYRTLYARLALQNDITIDTAN